MQWTHFCRIATASMNFILAKPRSCSVMLFISLLIEIFKILLNRIQNVILSAKTTNTFLLQMLAFWSMVGHLQIFTPTDV